MQDMNDQKISSDNGEVSLGTILYFLVRSFKMIFASTLMGVAIAIVYISLTPKQYEAVAQISMAKVSTPMSANPFVTTVNVEESSVLIFRLSTPTFFSPLVLSSCDLNSGAGNPANIATSIKLSSSKYSNNLVELKVFASSPGLAFKCATAVFELIEQTQSQIAFPYIENVKAQLTVYKQTLKQLRNEIAGVNATNSGMNMTYLLARDEIKFLVAKISEFEILDAINQTGMTKLVAPIYASDIPVAPNKSKILLLGLFGGIFFGLILAMLRQFMVGRDATKILIGLPCLTNTKKKN